MTSRPLIVILGIKIRYHSSSMKLWVHVYSCTSYIVKDVIAKDVSHSSVCASLGGDQRLPLSTCIEFQRQERQPRPPTALQWGREEAVQFMQLTQASLWVFITSGLHCLKEEVLQAVVHLT